MSRKRNLTAADILRLLEEDNDETDVNSDYSQQSDDDNEQDEILSSTADDDDEDATDGQQESVNESDKEVLKSKDGKEIWQCKPLVAGQGRANKMNILREKSGPTRFSNRECDSKASSFRLYFRKPLVEKICKWTNKEGTMVYKETWKTLDTTELEKFLGALILVGVYKSKNEDIAQLWSKRDGRPIFNRTMSRNRFQSIMRVLRFDDAEKRRLNRSEDKLEPIRYCFELWNGYLQDAYIPGACMTVDEQLVTFRGRCPFKQYIPSKPGRYGIKIWVICDSENSYVWKMQIYQGKESDSSREVKQGERVVKDIVKDIENSGKNITTDNFFTSLPLARSLLEKRLTLVGTIRKNKRELPESFVNTKGRLPNTTMFCFQKDAMIASYCPKKGKVVTLLSTMHSQPNVDENSEQKKPEVISSYNSTKSGVDTMDQMTRCYSVKRMTRRWPMVIFL
jgi:hypothetical protein